MTTTTLTLIKPDDWHTHLRDGKLLSLTVPHSARQFERNIVMPNLAPPITSVAAAHAYRERILAARPQGSTWQPLMTLYLTEQTDAATIAAAAHDPHIVAFKLYPAGATTHSEAGVQQLSRIYPALEAMEKHDICLLIHGESTEVTLDVFDREKVFIEESLVPIRERFPKLRVVLEHITTQDAVSFIESASDHTAATITAHHLLYNRNALFSGGLRPHYYCLPVLKRSEHQSTLIRAATSGNPKFFLGTDSAPHARTKKESACGCAGIYTAHAAMALYAEVFEMAGALDKLEGFASCYGADFYRLPRNQTTLTLIKKPQSVPQTFEAGATEIIPLRAGESISWQCEG